MSRLDPPLEARLLEFARALIDQPRASISVPPQEAASGFWFGGGNMVEDGDGHLYLVGRYRNYGDSRSGLSAGERGLELAIFCSDDGGQSFEKLWSFSKSDLDMADRRVLSIEGSALHWTGDGVELFVSTEKTGLGYPAGFEAYLKPGAGVWTIDRLSAASIAGLKQAKVQTVLESADPGCLHVKDPVSYDAAGGELVLMYCTHPFSWSSSNTAFAVRPPRMDSFVAHGCEAIGRGPCWDVAITRGTCILDVPRIGAFRDLQVGLLFYDGGESLRNLDEHQRAVSRPRGYSCEELGGVAYFVDGDLRTVQRLSRHFPEFVSPYGTGCSRYVDVLRLRDGSFHATWQQSRPDLSQPLVRNILTGKDVESLLS